MAGISESLHKLIVERAKGLCEYCQTQQAIVIEMQIDHVVPRSAGGKTEPDNLCLTCSSCNQAKYTFQTGIDPQTGEESTLYNPRIHQWNEHFAWNGDGTILIGLTPHARATISRLNINRQVAVAARRRWVSVGWHPPTITR